MKSEFALFVFKLLSLFIRQILASCLMMTHKDVVTAVQQ